MSTAPDKLTITLSEFEKSNIHGWLNYLLANPQYIGVPGRMTPGGPINLQTRIVLEEQTVARFTEIAKQFGVTWPPVVTPPIEPPAPPPTLPAECPVKLDIQAEFTPEERLNNQNVRVVQMWRDTVLVIPFRVPMPKNGVNFTQNDMVGFAICEFGSPPTFRQATLSKTPGDFGKQNSEGGLLPDPSVIASGGLTPNMFFFLKDGWAKPGDLIYANVRFWMTDYDTGKGKTTVQENQLDMAQKSRLSVQWPQDAH